jgi:rhamnose transport system substrate-binding protein
MRTYRAALAAVGGTAILVGSLGAVAMAQDAAVASPGQDVKMLFLPKFTDNDVFVQANQGAQEAGTELGLPTPPDFQGPLSTDPSSAQVEFVVNAPTQGYNAILLSNNAGEEIADAAAAAQAAGLKVVTWDSPIASGTGEDLFIAQVDFDETGKVMADMALSILGPEGGDFAILSAKPDSPNQNAWIAAMEEVLTQPEYATLNLVETVYGNDADADSVTAAQGLLDEHQDTLKLIMAPTTVGIKNAAKLVSDEGLCDTIKVSGLGLPSEMKEYTLNGCAPQFALWSFPDLGYLTTHAAYALATGAITGEVGESFTVGRPVSGNTTFTIEADPTRPDSGAKRVLMGPFSVYDASNIEAAAP